MITAVILIILALIVIYIYSRTDHPKVYAFFNTAAGIITLTAGRILISGSVGTISAYASALSSILGVPGAILCLLSGNL